MPAAVEQGKSQRLSLLGKNLYSEVQVALDKKDGVRLERGFQLMVGELPVPPEAIFPLDSTRIEFMAPERARPGIYTVTLTTPAGLSAQLDNALEVYPMGGTPSSSSSSSSSVSYVPPPGAGGASGGASGVGGGLGTTSGGATSSGGTGTSSQTGGAGTGGADAGAGGTTGPSAGGTSSGGSGPLPPGTHCLARDELDDCVHQCVIADDGSRHYCWIEITATVAECVRTSAPDPVACGTEQPSSRSISVGGSDLDNTRIYLAFDIPDVLPQDATLQGIFLRLATADHSQAPSPASGALWRSEPFARQDLFGSLPALLGAQPVVQRVGPVGRFTYVNFGDLRQAVSVPGMAYFALVSTHADRAIYLDRTTVQAPHLVIEYH